jgi:bifunctional DNA-binding transcriptional regulator/antitoxin component of YhaV-PrlF toxin-antitoxin module
MIISTKIRMRSGSMITPIPDEVVRRLGVKPGEALYWIEPESGHFVVSTLDPETVEALRISEEVTAKYRDVLKSLAD